jgi:hypothetical protein
MLRNMGLDVDAGYLAGWLAIGTGWGLKDWGFSMGHARDVFVHKPRRLLVPDEFERRRLAAELRLLGVDPLAGPYTQARV